MRRGESARDRCRALAARPSPWPCHPARHRAGGDLGVPPRVGSSVGVDRPRARTPSAERRQVFGACSKPALAVEGRRIGRPRPVADSSGHAGEPVKGHGVEQPAARPRSRPSVDVLKRRPPIRCRLTTCACGFSLGNPLPRSPERRAAFRTFPFRRDLIGFSTSRIRSRRLATGALGKLQENPKTFRGGSPTAFCRRSTAYRAQRSRVDSDAPLELVPRDPRGRRHPPFARSYRPLPRATPWHASRSSSRPVTSSKV